MKQPKYAISLTIGDKTFKGSGLTPLEALQVIPSPSKIITKGFLTISYGKLKKEMFFPPSKLKRLFYPNFQPIIAKTLGMGLR